MPNENGNKYYEGEIKNDDKHGKGISYYENGNKWYEGEWLNNEWSGQGIEYYENGNIELIIEEENKEEDIIALVALVTLVNEMVDFVLR